MTSRFDHIWIEAAALLGWKWSNAHNGYINENERTGPNWDDYVVAMDAEDACHVDGACVDTIRKAIDIIAEATPL